MLDATCDASGKVTAEGSLVPEAEVLSAGTAESEGLLFIEGENARYIPSSATDIGTTIEKLEDVIDSISAALNQIVTVITEVGAGMAGPLTAPPPTLAVDLVVITTKVTELSATKTELEQLKGSLK